MDSNILLSKIVANPTDSSWAQVYSTLNLYVVLSIQTVAAEVPQDSADEVAESTEETEEAKPKEEPELKPRISGAKSQADDKSIAALGKELLERIQREYFSQDEKSLENIKQAIEAAVSDVEDLKKISIVLANIKDEVLYLIVVSGAKVILKRRDKVATIAAGTPGDIEAYSGKIQPDDMILLETEGFAEKIPVEKLATTLDHLEVSQIAENFAPLIHEGSAGTEAAIVLHYKKLGMQDDMLQATSLNESSIQNEDLAENVSEKEETPQEPVENETIEDAKEENEKVDLSWEKDAEKNTLSEADDPISHLAEDNYKPPTKTPTKFSLGDRKKIVVIVIVLLIILFAGSIYYEKGRKETSEQNQIANEILTPAQQKFDEANALINLNKGLALDEFTDIKTSIESDLSKVPENTEARKKLDDFLKKVNDKINELGQGATLTNQEVINEDADLVAYRDDALIIVNSSGEISILDSDGKSTKDIDAKNGSVKALTANEGSVYVAGSDGISEAKKTGGSKIVVEDIDSIVAMDTFGTNLYALNSSEKTVEKYPTGSFSKSDYFTEDVTLNDPTSMSIDSSIWILDSGKVRKFTKGKEESFTVSGLTKDINPDSIITTGIDYDNVYVLDPTNRRVVAISKSGEVSNQFVSKDLANATSIAVDEPNKKIYVVISGKLNSFDL